MKGPQSKAQIKWEHRIPLSVANMWAYSKGKNSERMTCANVSNSALQNYLGCLRRCICHLSTHRQKGRKWCDILSHTTDGSPDFLVLSIILNFSSIDENSSYREKGMEEKSCNHRPILLFPVNQLANLSIIHPFTHLPICCINKIFVIKTTEWTQFSLRHSKASKFHCIPLLSRKLDGSVVNEYVTCVCVCVSVFTIGSTVNLFPLPLSLKTPSHYQEATLFHTVFSTEPHSLLDLTVSLELLCQAIFHQKTFDSF